MTERPTDRQTRVMRMAKTAKVSPLQLSNPINSWPFVPNPVVEFASDVDRSHAGGGRRGDSEV